MFYYVWWNCNINGAIEVGMWLLTTGVLWVCFIPYRVWAINFRVRNVSRWVIFGCGNNEAQSTWYFPLTGNRVVGFVLDNRVTLISKQAGNFQPQKRKKTCPYTQRERATK